MSCTFSCDNSSPPSYPRKHCECKRVTVLEPHFIFSISRTKKAVKGEDQSDIVNDSTNDSQETPPLVDRSIYTEIPPSTVAKLYLVIVDR